jgi:glycosyltransferase involved in cell wall biosynthesis
MRILFVAPKHYPPQRRGGTQSNTDELCKAMQRYGHDAAVLADISKRTWFGMLNRARCLVYSTHCWPPDEICGYPVFRSIGSVTEFRKSLDEVLRYFAPHVVVTQARDAINLAYQVLSRGVPTAVYLHEIAFGYLGQLRKDAPLVRFLANSKFTTRKFRELLGMEATIMYNLFAPERYYTEQLGERVTFINPHPEKGAEMAFSLAERCPAIPFLFVGSWGGPPEKGYKARAKAARNISWVPSTPDMRSIYRKTRILIVPSRVDEAWGRVVTEAQFSGIPVLASDRGGLPESVGEGGMLLVDDDFDSWQTALEDLWSSDQRWRQLSKNALQHAARPEIRPSIIVKQFLDFLDQIRMKEPLGA